MPWVEASIEVDREAAEAVAEVLSRYAHQGVAIEIAPEAEGPVIVRAYLESDDDLWQTKQAVRQALWHLDHIWSIPELTFRPIPEEDWTEAWKDHMSVLHVGERIVIHPSWLDYDPTPNEVLIQLDPGMAFGTGLHPTTQLSLEAIERALTPGDEVLDIGTGSGILAIAAAKLGAGRVYAVDNDAQAVEIARENAVANGVIDAVDLACGSLERVTGTYPLVVVNILAHVIRRMLEQGLGACVKAGGTLIATGIMDEQASDVVGAMERQGLTLVERHQRGDWVSLIATRA